MRAEALAARLAEIEELAESISELLFSTEPVTPERLLREERISFCYGHYEDAFDGLLECHAKRFHVYCNLDRVGRGDRGRARFTLAHELGHYFIDEHRRALLSGLAPSHPSFSDYQSRLPIEREADAFASALLMPSSRFWESVQTEEPGLEAILRASDEFVTSRTSAAVRYVHLDLLPCALIRWNADQSRWYLPSASWKKLDLGEPVDSPEVLQPMSPTRAALAVGGRLIMQYVSTVARASDWFQAIPAESPSNVQVLEQAIPLGRYGAMTLLTSETHRHGWQRNPARPRSG